MICLYTFKAFSLPTDVLEKASVDFVCFDNEENFPGWIQKEISLDILSFSSIRQQKILKILPWKYLSEYDYAIWCESAQCTFKGLLTAKNVINVPNKDCYVIEGDIIDNDFDFSQNNLNIKSQLEKYFSLSKYLPKYFQSTEVFGVNNRSVDFKNFSIQWINETLKESLADEVSFSWLLSTSFSFLDVQRCHEDMDVDAFFKIVIPNYNNGSALESCLNSILSQSFRSFKIVIVDDCSTDNSIDIAKRFAEMYPDMVFLTSTEERSYSGKARNLGIDFNKFTSKYTWFIDGDDIIYKDSVLKDLYEKASITNADLISFDCIYVKDKKPNIHKFSVPDFSDSSALDQFGIAPWHRIVKTEKVERFFENCIRRQDLATVFRQYNACKNIVHLDKVCYIYNSRDYTSLSEPVWSLQNIFLELQLQISDTSISENIRHTIKEYLDKYPKIFGQLNVERLKSQKVVALASYPLRKEGMLKVFNQLFPQCDHFCLYLNEYKEIPEELLSLSNDKKKKLTIEIGGKNLKDYGKFFWFKKFPGYYMTVDDDLDYPEDYCDTLVAKMQSMNNKAVVGLHGNDFTILDGSCVVKKTCHPFSGKEDHDVPIDCIGTGAACFYPDALNFTFTDVVKHYDADEDLDMSVSILVKSEKKMLYRIASRKDFVLINGFNLVNPLANIDFAWEKRYVQYDLWLNRDSENEFCAYCIIPWNKIDIEMMQILSDIKNDYNNKQIDFYCIPIEQRDLLKSKNNDLYFAKFAFVKKFLERYQKVILHQLTDKEIMFEFDRKSDMLDKIFKVKSMDLKRMNDKILMANLKKFGSV